jgi:hypothetical protein
VRKSFLAISARLTPRLDRILDRAVKKRLRSLGTWDLPLPVATSEPTKKRVWLNLPAKYPALVELPKIQTKNDRLAYLVQLPFRRRPKDRELSWIYKELHRVISAHADSEKTGAGKAVRPDTVIERGGGIELTLTPRFFAASAQAARVGDRLKALAKSLRTALLARVKKASGVTLAPFDAKLKYYEDTKRLPGLASVARSGGQFQVLCRLAIKKLKGKEDLDALRRERRQAMDGALSGSQ